MYPSKPTSQPIFIVDVDETLFDTIPRKIAILRDLLGVEITYEEARADYNLRNHLHSQEQIDDFFGEFHSGKYLHFEVAIECAPQVLQRLVERLTIVYLTGRHAEGAQPWMAQKSATLQSFQRFGFPLPNNQNTFLVMKPYYAGFESIEKQAVEDRMHKTKIVSQLVAQQHVLAGIGDSFTDLSVYSEHNVFPICLKRSHWSYFKDKLSELAIQPFIANNWLEAEKRVLELLEQAQT